jgi:hypothetical protein
MQFDLYRFSCAQKLEVALRCFYGKPEENAKNLNQISRSSDRVQTVVLSNNKHRRRPLDLGLLVCVTDTYNDQHRGLFRNVFFIVVPSLHKLWTVPVSRLVELSISFWRENLKFAFNQPEQDKAKSSMEGWVFPVIGRALSHDLNREFKLVQDEIQIFPPEINAKFP